MGTLDLQTLQALLSPASIQGFGGNGSGKSNAPFLNTVAQAFTPRAAKTLQDLPAMLQPRTPKDTFGLGGEREVDDPFQAITYQRHVEQATLAVRFQEVAARVAQAQGQDGATQEVTAGVQQTTFSFFAETRTEEVIRFNERTGAVAENLEGAQRERFMEASQTVSTRFSLSVSMSGTVLSGFAQGAESLAETDKSALDRFNAFATDMVSRADEVANEIFELLEGLFTGEGNLSDRFDQFLTALNDAGLLSIPGLEVPGGEGLVEAQFVAVHVQLEFSFEATTVTQATAREVGQSSPTRPKGRSPLERFATAPEVNEKHSGREAVGEASSNEAYLAEIILRYREMAATMAALSSSQAGGNQGEGGSNRPFNLAV